METSRWMAAGGVLAIVAGIGCGESGGAGGPSAVAGRAGEGGEAPSAGSSSTGGADQSGGQSNEGGEGGSGGDGAPACTADLLNDPEHCGSCERACAGEATCNRGHCVETILEDFSVWGMAGDDDYLYAIGYYSTRDVYRIDRASGQAERVISEENAASVYGFALDDANFYLTTGSRAYSAPKTGSTFELLGTVTNGTGDSSRAAIAADGDYVYWSGWEGIFRAPAAGGETVQWVTAGVSMMWRDGDTLWWGCRDFAGFKNRLISEAPTTEFSPSGVSFNGTPDGFARDDTHIFFLDTLNPLGNYLGVVPKDGGDMIPLVDLYQSGSDIAVSGSYVFYDNYEQLLRIPKTGGPATVYAEFGDLGLYNLYADEDYLYFGSGYVLYRMTRD